MLKWVRRILLFLLLGAIVNVAVAWGCVVRANGATGEKMWYVNPRKEQSIAVESLRCFGYQQVRLISDIEYSISPLHNPTAHPFESRVWWPTGTVRSYLRTGDPGITAVRTRAWRPTDALDNLPARHFGAGWPWLSLRASTWPDPVHLVTGQFRKETRWGIDLDTDVFDTAWNARAPLLLPLYPIWTGSIPNIMLYSTGMAVACFCYRSPRRAIRTRRGLCPACGYPRGSSPVCTECGEALPC